MDLHPTVNEFFRSQVVDALKSRQVTAAEPTEFYLVNLLAEFTKASNVDREPLALKMAQISTATPDVKAKGLKEIGDTSLYVSGFFADSLTRRLVDVDYYISMGGAAYSQLASLMGSMRGSASGFFQAAYQELASKFAAFVNVLSEVRSRTNFGGGSNVFKMYEQWVKTGGEWLEGRLREAGLVTLTERVQN